jgi:sugar-specific transcriptional regulator TrmB
MKSKELIEKFKAIGFKEYEAKIFLVLLTGRLMSATEISTEAKLIRTSIYDTLKTFVERGYCNEIETPTILKFQIIDPQVITDKIEKELNEANTKRISSLKDVFSEASIAAGYGKDARTEEEDNIELIRGFNKHRVVKYTALVNSAEKEILGMNRIRGIVTDELKSSAEELVRTGGVIRYIYKISLDFKIKKDGKLLAATKDDLIKLCRSFEKFGEQVRLTEMNIPNAGIFDGKTAYINVSSKNPNTKNKQSDLIIKNSDFVDNLKDMFEFYWQNSLTIDEYEANNK